MRVRIGSTEKPLNTRFPAVWAGIASLFIPGLGQILSRQARRGILLLLSLGTTVGLLIWRIYEIAFREKTAAGMFIKALQRNTFFTGLVLACVVAIWLWTAWDAYSSVKKKRQSGSSIFLVILLAFFALGWQISEIDLVKMIRDLPDALPPLSRVLWPWEAAITYDQESLEAGAEILASAEGKDAPPVAVEKEREPYVKVEPTYGLLSTRDEQNNLVPGTPIVVTGRNFEPATFTEIWWQDPVGNEFRPREGGKYLSVVTDDAGSFYLEMTMPYRLVPPSAETLQMHQVKAKQISQVGGAKASDPLKLTIGRMIETIFMGMMATFFGIIFSIPVSFLAARNIMSGSWVTMMFYYITRAILNIIRSIEPLIWALIAVVWVGLGPFAGIIALTIHSIAALGKLYSEAVEGIDSGPIEAIQATGANRLQTIMFAVIPQMISPFISFSIYRWDINVRMSTVIGLVGGGGIGFILVQYIRLLDYKAAGIAVWFIAITVAVLDYVSSEIRNRLA
ncbi:MAG: phosphonate ABC transporter, permease protein PhnE [Spirochaetales bacterium]|nr:phosphonate ABC transporter, permease protein PhnE [Spirochaetales bacterium]